MLTDERIQQVLDEIVATLIVLTPDEVDSRVKIGDQFIKEILTKCSCST